MHRLLIIDDQSTMLTALVLAFEGEYEIRFAASGEEGVRITQEWQPDVIVTDYKMPGMDGLEVINQIAKARKQGKPGIILFSSRMDQDLINQAKSLGADACLAKPFDLMELKALVRKILG